MRVVCETRGESLITRETVAIETPARSLTCCKLAPAIDYLPFSWGCRGTLFEGRAGVRS